MKQDTFKVIYLNGNEEKFRAFGFTNAIILAMAYAINKGWDKRIKYVEDSKGVCIKNIESPTFTFA